MGLESKIVAKDEERNHSADISMTLPDLTIDLPDVAPSSPPIVQRFKEEFEMNKARAEKVFDVAMKPNDEYEFEIENFTKVYYTDGNLKLKNYGKKCRIAKKTEFSGKFLKSVNTLIKDKNIATQNIVKIGAYAKIHFKPKHVNKKGDKQNGTIRYKHFASVTKDNYKTSADFVTLPKTRQDFVVQLEEAMGDSYYSSVTCRVNTPYFTNSFTPSEKIVDFTLVWRQFIEHWDGCDDQKLIINVSVEMVQADRSQKRFFFNVTVPDLPEEISVDEKEEVKEEVIELKAKTVEHKEEENSEEVVQLFEQGKDETDEEFKDRFVQEKDEIIGCDTKSALLGKNEKYTKEYIFSLMNHVEEFAEMFKNRLHKKKEERLLRNAFVMMK